MKKQLILIFLLVLNLFANNNLLLSGHWKMSEYTDNRSDIPYHLLDMNISIDKKKNVTGTFEYYYKWTAHIDDAEFTSKLQNNSFIFSFDSSFGGENGKVRITINDNCSLKWDLIQEPNGDFFAPYEANLGIEKLEVNNFCKYNKKSTIQTQKQALYKEANENSKTNMYLVKDDVVEILEEKDDWIYILYNSKDNKEIKAWIPKNALEF